MSHEARFVRIDPKVSSAVCAEIGRRLGRELDEQGPLPRNLIALMNRLKEQDHTETTTDKT